MPFITLRGHPSHQEEKFRSGFYAVCTAGKTGLNPSSKVKSSADGKIEECPSASCKYAVPGNAVLSNCHGSDLALGYY